MSFSNTFAYAIARAVDVATASILTKHTDCTISSLCDVARTSNDVADGYPFLRWLGRLLNRISSGHTASARQSDIAKARAIIAYLAPNLTVTTSHRS